MQALVLEPARSSMGRRARYAVDLAALPGELPSRTDTDNKPGNRYTVCPSFFLIEPS